MNKRTRIRFAIFAIVLVAVLGVSAVFASSALADVKPIIRLTVVNSSQFDFSLYIFGENYGNEYTMNVPPYSQSKIFIKPDEYSYYMEACNYSKFGEMDLWVFQTLHVPVCGGKAAGYQNKSHHIDISKIFKPVRVKIRNMTGQAVELYLRTMDDHHFLTLEQGEHLEVILRKESGIDYVYSFLACGDQLITGYYTPRQTPPLDLVCP
jgi:hypothetical protein